MDSNIKEILNTRENREKLIQIFPLLSNDVNFEILSPRTPIYNCIAWAMQFADRWVDIYDLPGHWWPNGVARNSSPESLVCAFEAVGFSVTDDDCIEDDFNKVILYKDVASNEWTHASRLVAESIEHSKFGEAWDGSHSRNSISGDCYGIPYCIMKRRKSHSCQFEKKHGQITANLDLLKGMLKK